MARVAGAAPPALYSPALMIQPACMVPLICAINACLHKCCALEILVSVVTFHTSLAIPHVVELRISRSENRDWYARLVLHRQPVEHHFIQDLIMD